MLNRTFGLSGRLSYKVIRAPGPGLMWKLRNTFRWSFLYGLLGVLVARFVSKVFGILTVTAKLEARLIRADGSVINYGVLSYRQVTNAGIGFLVDDWVAASQDIGTMNNHACGTNNTAEAPGDTALVAEATTITDRVAGTLSEPTSVQVRSVGTQAFTNTGAIVEHGLFSVITESTGVLWDRSVFAVINVGNGDSIQWTYTLSFTGS